MSKRQREVEEIVEEARRQGWRCVLRANGHWQCLAPNGVGIVPIAGTPSDHKWRDNTIQDAATWVRLAAAEPEGAIAR